MRPATYIHRSSHKWYLLTPPLCIGVAVVLRIFCAPRVTVTVLHVFCPAGLTRVRRQIITVAKREQRARIVKHHCRVQILHGPVMAVASASTLRNKNADFRSNIARIWLSTGHNMLVLNPRALGMPGVGIMLDLRLTLWSWGYCQMSLHPFPSSSPLALCSVAKKTWWLVKRLGQATNEYPPPLPSRPRILGIFRGKEFHPSRKQICQSLNREGRPPGHAVIIQAKSMLVQRRNYARGHEVH